MADLWSDSVRKRAFLSVKLHYLIETFELHARTLQVKDVEGLSHTASFLLGVFNEALMDFRIHETSRCTVVTDCGSSMCGAAGNPSTYNWIPCADQKIATMITTVLANIITTENGMHSPIF